MAQSRIRALTLKKTKLGETDLIITMLAEDGCQVRAVAKGARKPGAKLGGRVEPFTVIDALVTEGRSLDIITDAEIVMSNQALREDYDRSIAASVVADFLDKVSVECQAEDRLFALATTTFSVMAGAPVADLLALVVAFLLKGMAMHGYRPQFGACAECGSCEQLTARFSLDLGGPLCEGCGAGPDVVPLTTGTAHALHALMGARMSEVGELGIDEGTLADAFAVARAFAVYHIPARLKALAMYGAGVAP